MDFSARNLELERWSSLDENWLKFWTFLVIVGVALELCVVWIEYRSELHEFRKGIIRPPDRPGLAKLLLELFGVGLVTVGVACELLVTNSIGSITAELRRNSEQEISVTNARAERLRIDTEKERSARIDIEERVEWRRIPKEKRIEFAIGLSRFVGQRFIISADSLDTEGNLFASDLLAALQTTRWTYPPIHTVGGAGSSITSPDVPPQTGIEILSPTTRRSAANALVLALSQLGFDSHVRDRAWDNSSMELWIMVHARPFGPQGEAKLRHEAKAKVRN